MTLHLLQLLPESAALVRFAHRAGLPEHDPGYLWHRALRDAFGSIAPQPFRLLQQEARPARLLGYGAASADALREALAFAEPDLDRLFPPERIQSKELPLPFPVGRRLGFETRVCPIVRTTRGDGSGKRELDAFVHHALGIVGEPAPEREVVYHAWLADRLTSVGCRLLGARMTSFRLAPLVRRHHASPAVPEGQAAPARRLLAKGRHGAALRPEVVFDGVLEVAEPDIFASSLGQGIGRHRAFGFGMLLLRPA